MAAMMAAIRVLGLLVMAVVPGGLLVVAAYVLAKVVSERVRLEQGTRSRRLARAFVAVRWRDVWTSAKQTL